MLFLGSYLLGDVDFGEFFLRGDLLGVGLLGAVMQGCTEVISNNMCQMRGVVQISVILSCDHRRRGSV